jgi:uncharacterized protein YbjQ (UPF0145 family)
LVAGEAVSRKGVYGSTSEMASTLLRGGFQARYEREMENSREQSKRILQERGKEESR